MMEKPALLFMTNMPTPYQLDFFNELERYFDLHVCYFSERELDRQWSLAAKDKHYRVTVLGSYGYARELQSFIPSFHHSPRLAGFMRETHFDMAVINGTYWTPNVRIALREASRKNTRVAFWGEPLLPSSAWLRVVKKMAFQAVREYTDFLMAVGERAVDSYRSMGYTKPIYNLPYNIDGQLFRKENLDQAERLRYRARYREGVDIVFLSSGSLIRRKGMDRVIRAFRAVSPDIRARLVIVGDGPERKRLEMLSGDADVVFTGFQDKAVLPYIYAVSDIFVLATRYDGWAVVINEAMEAGIAVIASDKAGAVNDLLEDGENGLICQADDVEGLRSLMEELALDTRKREAMTEQALQKISGISSRVIAKKLYGIYNLA
jgi:glycosyltransferase involved in cell wall biosynthesis